MDTPTALTHKHVANHHNTHILSPVFKKCNYGYIKLTDRYRKLGAPIDNH